MARGGCAVARSSASACQDIVEGVRKVRIVTVVGTRPQLIKLAALQPALRRRHEDVFVDTGQHWDEAMAGAFFRELGLPQAGPLAGDRRRQRARSRRAGCCVALEPVLVGARPDAVLVMGDTNSTLAGALAAAQLGDPRGARRSRSAVASTGGCPRRSTASSPTTSRAGRSRRRRPPSRTSQPRGSRTASTSSGTSCRTWWLASRPRSAMPDARCRPPAALDRRYLFATIHRAENREPDAVRQWAGAAGRRRHARAAGRPCPAPGDAGRARWRSA